VSTISELHQYDLHSFQPGMTAVLLDTADGNWSCCYASNFGSHQIGPDGKIYIENGNNAAPFIHVINYPDSAGTQSDFQERGLYFADNNPPLPKIDSMIVDALPNNPNYSLEPLPLYKTSPGIDTIICIGDKIQIGDSVADGVIYQWEESESLEDQTVAQPWVDPIHTTTYYLTVIDTSSNPAYSCRELYDSVTVTIDESCSHLIQIGNPSPNPTSNEITLEYTIRTTDKGRWLFYNILGQQQAGFDLAGGRHRLTIKTSDWSHGYYFYKVWVGDKEVKSGKIVVYNWNF